MENNTSYQYCRRTTAAVAALWRDIRAGRSPAAEEIRLRRKRDDTVQRALFDELRRAFLTPIDREDLWALVTACGALFFAVEETALELKRQRYDRIPETGELWEEIGGACEAIRQAVEGFVQFHRRDDTTEALRRLKRHAARARRARDERLPTLLAAGDLRRIRLYDGGMAILDHCEVVADRLLTAILKNE